MAEVKVKRIPTKVALSGAESSLDSWSNFFLIAVAILMPILVIVQIGPSALGLSIALYFLVIGLFFKALLSGASDVVRLLKKQCDVPYSGDISGEIKESHKMAYACGSCGVAVQHSQEKCDNCGETLHQKTLQISERKCPKCSEVFNIHPIDVIKGLVSCRGCHTSIDLEQYLVEKKQTCPHCGKESELSPSERINSSFLCVYCDSEVDLQAPPV